MIIDDNYSIWGTVKHWNNKYFPNWQYREPIFLSNALAGEVGELCNLVKKYYGGGTHLVKVTPHDMGIEAVDIIIYLIMFCECIGVDDMRFMSLFKTKIQQITQRMDKQIENKANNHD